MNRHRRMVCLAIVMLAGTIATTGIAENGPEVAEQVIAISRSFNIDAQVIGRIEEGLRSLTIRSEFGEFNY